jgi:hypothetical protein
LDCDTRTPRIDRGDNQRPLILLLRVWQFERTATSVQSRGDPTDDLIRANGDFGDVNLGRCVGLGGNIFETAETCLLRFARARLGGCGRSKDKEV